MPSTKCSDIVRIMVAEDGPPAVAALPLAAAGIAPSQARRFVIERLAAWQLSAWEASATLIVSELVTNALLHARTDMVVSLSRLETAVLLEVTDNSAQLPTQRRYSLHAGTGRGLNLVARLAQDWGVRAEGNGKTVWALLSATDPEEVLDELDLDSVEAL